VYFLGGDRKEKRQSPMTNYLCTTQGGRGLNNASNNTTKWQVGQLALHVPPIGHEHIPHTNNLLN